MTNSPVPSALAVLHAEFDRLRSVVALARSRYADLLAAARATIAADRDGEYDPLFYLRRTRRTRPAPAA